MPAFKSSALAVDVGVIDVMRADDAQAFGEQLRGKVIGFELGPSATLPSSNCPVILLPGWAKSSVPGLSVEVNIAPRAVEALRRPGAPSEQGVQPMTTVTNSRIGI